MYAPPRLDLAHPIRVNLYSDTQTKPTRAMREAMMAAEVGDDQLGSDPTVNALCDRVAALMGKQAAMFLPSGTMCNEIALLTECRPGDEVLAHASSHIVTAEGGAPWALAGVQVTGLPGPRGQFSAEAVRDAVRPRSRYAPPQRMLVVEQTANLGGGALRPAPVGAYPAGASAYGVEQLLGDVWEWTSSDFTAWPGFTPMLYAQYSEPFFGGDYKVLRGGSWAVGRSVVRPSFRNWDHPVRRQVFSGFRLAWSVDGAA